ncbi:hypothetical protein GCM10027344_12540 [Spelaeicoccus albus]
MRDSTIAGFALCAAAVIVIAVWGAAGRALASFPALMKRVLASRSAAVVLVVFWWWAGWHFLVER